MEDVVVTSEFWRDRRVFLTGHTGFKGSWAAAWLHRAGSVLCGYALAPEPGALFDADVIAPSMVSIINDVRDLSALSAAMAGFNPEVVIHMAAQPFVRASYDDPVGTYATNVLGTVHLLDAVRRTPSVKAVVIVTTDKCYENREWVWPYRETDALGGHDPYANSKACAEMVAAAYRDSFLARRGVGVATARAGNVIGGGDRGKDRLLPDAIAAFEAKRILSLRHPDAVRPWQHVLDAVYGYLLLAERLYGDPDRFAGAFNFGPSDTAMITVRDVVEQVIACYGAGAYDVDGAEHPHESLVLRLDSSKARTLLGWRPILCVDEAVRWAVEGYRSPDPDIVGRQTERYWSRLNA